MKTFKFIMILAVLLCVGTFAEAQYDDYLNTALTLLDNGDCDNAERNYNVYKKLTGKTSAFVEKGLAECNGSNKQSAKGPMLIQINYQNYEVLPRNLDGVYTWLEAKSVCENLTAFGKSDWYLPDMHEIMGLPKQLLEIDSDIDCFPSGYYWTSSEMSQSSVGAWFYSFNRSDDPIIDKLKTPNSKDDYARVRCIRKN